MLLNRGHVLSNDSETSSVITERYEISWRGLVYWPGSPAGAPSIRKFAEAMGSGLADAAARLKGVYFIALRDRWSDLCYAFVDNSALYHGYYSTRFAGTSFLEIVALEDFQPRDLDPDAVVEFLHFGCIYSGKTFFRSIRKIDADAIVLLSPNGKIELLSKALPDIATPVEQSFEELLGGLSDSVAFERVSLDLTGGVDSRLLAVVLSYFGMPFELAGSGMAGNQDLQIAETVAHILGREFYPTYHNAKGTDWTALFEICDGLFDLAKADRPLQLQRDRVARGVTLAISGAGGELFKDFWWLQDFPFYTRCKPNLERLYATRIAPAEPDHSLLAGNYRAISQTYRERLLGTLSGYAVAGNTQTYDHIYYAFKMREFAGRFLTNSAKLMQVHAPFLDHEAMQIAYGMKRWERFFNNYHRRVITRFSPAAARMPTTEGGMTVSSERKAVWSDLRKYVNDRCVRIVRKAGQRWGRKAYSQENADHPDLASLLRQMIVTGKCIDRLKNYGILDRAVKASQVRSGYLGSLLALDMLIARLESNIGGIADRRVRELAI
jgi:asparagine synthetase B (glutamine-hydrolysing)